MDLTLLSLSIKVFEFEFSPLFLPFPPSHHSLSHFLCPFLLLSCSFGLLLLPHSLSHSLFPSLLNLSLFPVPSVSSFSPLSLSLPPSPSLSFLFPQFPHSPRSISHSPFLSPSLLHLSLSLSHYFPFSPFSQTLPFCSPSLSLFLLVLSVCLSVSLSLFLQQPLEECVKEPCPEAPPKHPGIHVVRCGSWTPSPEGERKHSEALKIMRAFSPAFLLASKNAND